MLLVRPLRRGCGFDGLVLTARAVRRWHTGNIVVRDVVVAGGLIPFGLSVSGAFNRLACAFRREGTTDRARRARA